MKDIFIKTILKNIADEQKQLLYCLECVCPKQKQEELQKDDFIGWSHSCIRHSWDFKNSKYLSISSVWQPSMADISFCDQYKRLVSETASRWKSLDPPAKQLHSVSFKHALSVNKQMTGGLFLLLGASQ